jgi:hypothetical protein
MHNAKLAIMTFTRACAWGKIEARCVLTAIYFPWQAD